MANEPNSVVTENNLLLVGCILKKSTTTTNPPFTIFDVTANLTTPTIPIIPPFCTVSLPNPPTAVLYQGPTLTGPWSVASPTQFMIKTASTSSQYTYQFQIPGIVPAGTYYKAEVTVNWSVIGIYAESSSDVK